MRVGGTTLLAVALVLLGAVSAAAQDDGVFIDPDSPTAKQYKLPIESARRQADPKGGGKLAPPGARPAGTTAAPLFGEGIAATASGAKSRGDKGRAKPNSGKSPAPGESSPQSSTAPLKAAVQNPGAPSGGVGAPLLIAGGAALVLLLGTLVGLLLRRRRAD